MRSPDPLPRPMTLADDTETPQEAQRRQIREDILVATGDASPFTLYMVRGLLRAKAIAWVTVALAAVALVVLAVGVL